MQTPYMPDNDIKKEIASDLMYYMQTNFFSMSYRWTLSILTLMLSAITRLADTSSVVFLMLEVIS